MEHETEYTLLMSSLPHQPGVFGSRQTPISRLRLEQRLSLLRPEHSALLEEIESVLFWERLPPTATDPALAQAGSAFLARLESESGILWEIVQSRLDMRTLIAALRRRARNLPPLARNESWGCCRWRGFLERYWTETDFRLGRQVPWLIEADHLLRSEDSLGLERLLLSQTWASLGRLGEGHWFDFPAVVIYVLRWQIIHRWTTAHGPTAAQRFEELTKVGMGNYEKVFAD